MTPEETLALIDTWTRAGWLRPLEQAFVRFLYDQEPGTSGEVLLAAALTSHQLGRGHLCLDISTVCEDPDQTLSLPPEGESGPAAMTPPSRILENLHASRWEEVLLTSPLVEDNGGTAPLVLSGGRLYLRRYWEHTRTVFQEISARLVPGPPPPPDLEHRLDRLFAPLRNPEEKQKTAIHWQSVAAALAVRNRFTIISGGPGTGKTTVVIEILKLLQELAFESGAPLVILLAAPTGKAAARLTESMSKRRNTLPESLRDGIPGEVSTLHRLLGTRPDSRRFNHNRKNPLHADLVVVDEASMVDLEMMAALVEALPERARLILLGDKDQLASVEAGAVLGDLCRNAGTACYSEETVAWLRQATGYDLSAHMGRGTPLDQHVTVLKRSHRFTEKSGIGNLAAGINTGDPDRVEAVWSSSFSDIFHVKTSTLDSPAFRKLILNGSPECFTAEAGARPPLGYRAYLQRISRGPEDDESMETWLRSVLDLFGRFQVLSPLRKGEWGVEMLNRTIESILIRENLISGGQGWYTGRPVLVTGNDYSLGLMNGDVGITVLLPGNAQEPRKLRVVFSMADASLKKIAPSRLSSVETMYAMTVHKAQGSEFHHTALVLPPKLSPVLTRELVYTGITRARKFLSLLTPDPALPAQAAARKTRRASGLSDLFDGQDFTGISVDAPAPRT